MLKRKELLEEVHTFLGTLSHYIEFENANGYFDINTFCEDVFCGLLNIIYELRLENLNKIKVNFPAVDLGDSQKRVCFQVTSTSEKKKIVDTIRKFSNNNLSKDFNELNILILGSKKKYSKGLPEECEITEFDMDRNIIDLKDLSKIINGLSINRIEDVLSYLRRNIEKVRYSTESYLKGIEEMEIQYPTHYSSYLEILGISNNDEDGKKQIIHELNQFMNDLKELDKKTREVICAIIEKRNSIDDRGIYFNPIEIERYLRLEKQIIADEFRILLQRTYVSTPDDNGTEYFMLEYWIDGQELLHEIVEYCEKRNLNIRDVLIKLNFSLLD